MNISKTIALMIIVGLVSYALLLYFKAPPTPTLPRKKVSAIATPILDPQTKLYFSPPLIILTSSSPQEIPVLIATGQNTVTQAQVEIQYDPKVILVTSVRPGSFFPGSLPLVNKNDEKRGRIEFAIGVSENHEAVRGTGSLLFIQFIPGPEASTSGKTRLSFLPKSSVRGQGQTTSLLLSSESLTIESRLPTLSP